MQQLRSFSFLVGKPRMRQLLTQLQPLAAQVMCDEPRMWGDQLIIKPPHSDVRVAWHQDGAYWCNEHNPQLLNDGDSAVTCWIALVDVTLDMGPGGIEIIWGPHVESLHEDFVRALKIALNVKYAFAGAEAVKADGVRFGTTGECQVCGSELGGNVVKCRRCGTPHHADCWKYTGRCSTFGCGSTKSRKAKHG